MSDKPGHISEEEAARLWKRAAELQAEAAALQDAPVSEDTDDVDDLPDTSGYALEHVRAAAVEAGIATEFVDEAFSELSSRQALPAPPSGALDDVSKRFLDDPPDYIEAVRIIDAPMATVLASMERVFPAPPYTLSLRDRQGTLGAGGVLVFDIEGATFTATEGFLGTAAHADMREVYASIRKIEGRPERCEVTLRSPIAWARSINFWFGVVFTALGGGVGIVGGTAAAAGVNLLTGAMSLPILAAVLGTALVVLGVVSGGGLTVHGFRLLFDAGVKKGEKALQGLLNSVAMDAQGGWGITPPATADAAKALPPHSDADGDATG